MSQLGRLLATKRENEKLPGMFTMWLGQRGTLAVARKGAIVVPFKSKCVAICASIRASGTAGATELQVEKNAATTELVGTSLDMAAAAGAPAQAAVSMADGWAGIDCEAGDRLHLYIDAVASAGSNQDINVVFTFATM